MGVSTHTGKERLPPRFRVADLLVDVPRREVWRDDQLLDVEPRVFELLVHLATHGDRVVTRDELLDEVWHDKVVSESTLYRAIKLTRDLFGADTEAVRTIHGRGYRLTAEVVPAAVAEVGDSQGTIGGWTTGRRLALAALAALAIAAAVPWWMAGSGEGEHSPGVVAPMGGRHLAVLSLKGHAADDDFFGGALAAQLRTDLARVDGLEVLGPQSSLHAEDLAREPGRLGRRFGVDRLLRGTWQRAGGQTLINLELLSLPDTRLLWSGNFRQTDDEIGELGRRLAATVTAALQLPAVNPAGESLPLPAPETGSAYGDYLRARHLWRQRDPEALSEARRLLEAIVVEAPGFARAHEALASVYLVLPSWQAVDRAQAHALATAAAREALRLEPRLGEARAILAQEAQRQGRWAEAHHLFQEALEREPANPTILHWYAELLLVVGHLERAKEVADRAVAIDPLAPMPHTVAAWAAIVAGDRPRQAAAEARTAVELGLVSSNVIVAWAEKRRGNAAAAAEALRSILSPTRATGLCALALEGGVDAERARTAVLEEPRRDDLAVIYHLTCLALTDRPQDFLSVLGPPPIAIPFAIVWAPEFAPVRAGSEFRRLVEETDLLDFWRAQGPPSRCEVQAGDLRCD